MPTQAGTLKAGYQLVIDITNGDSSTTFDYSVSGTTVRDNGKAWKSDRAIGPFAEDVTYSVTYSGFPEIFITQPNGQREYTAESAPSAESLNAGDVVVVSGLASIKTGDRLAPTEIKQRETPRLCFVGSSLTQHGNNIGTQTIMTDTRGWPCWLMMILQESAVAEQWIYTEPVTLKRFTVGSNRGYSGQFAATIDARKEDIAAMGADVYIIQQGTNDLASEPTETTIAAIQSTAKYLRNTGAVVVLLTEPCRNFSAGSVWLSGGLAQLKRETVNEAKRELARTEYGIACVESDKYIMKATGEAKAGYLYDGTHFAPVGAYYFALAIYEAIAGVLFPKRDKVINAQGVYDATYNPGGNLLANPMLASVASGWTKSSLPTGVSAFNIVNNSDGTTTITVTTDGTGTAGAIASVNLQQTIKEVINSVSQNMEFDTNDAVQFGIKVKSITQADSLYSINPYMKQQFGGSTISYVSGGKKYISGSIAGTKTSYLPVISIPLWNKTPAMPIEKNVSIVVAQLFIEVNAGVAGTNIFTVEGLDMRRTQMPWDIVGVKQDTGYASQNYFGGTDA